MNNDNKTMNKTEYAEKVRDLIDPRILNEATTHRFNKRSSPVTTWLAAACFALIFAAAALLLIKPMRERPVEANKPTAAPTADPTADPTEDITPPISEEDARNIIARLIVYHKEQFTRSAKLGDLKLSPSVAADLEKRQRCIDETEARLGKDFSKASVTGSTTFGSFTPNGENMTVSFTELTKLVTGGAASDHIVITAEHTAEIAPDGTILSDFFSEDAIGFTNISSEPTAQPIPYNRTEYDTLLAFFELADENGVKNGEKCFKGYDPSKVDFWGTNPEDLINTKESYLIWNDEGKLSSIVLYGLDEPSAKLVGKINLNRFDFIEALNAHNIVFDSFNEDMRNCSKISYISFSCENEAVLTADYIDRVSFVSFSHARYESYDENFLAGALAFTADLTADGSGSVGIYAYGDTHYYVVYIYAHPIEGHKFLGWYDADGKLISTEAEIELSYEHDTGWSVHDFTGTARFEQGEDKSELVNDPWYLEKAWEYAEFANREYGFSFERSAWELFDNAIIFRASKPGMNNRQNLYVFFHERNGEEIIEPVLMGDSSDIPAGYSSLGEAERISIHGEIAALPDYSVTPQEMREAGYTLDGTEQDYIKIAEYCGRRYAAMFTGCSEINPQFCNEAEAVNARRTEWMLDSAKPIYCLVSYCFRPAYPLAFTDRYADIGCSINDLDDAEHPGWITFTGDVLITPTADGWDCDIAFISGY